MKLASILSLALMCCFVPGALSYFFGGSRRVKCRFEDWSECRLDDGEFLKQRDPLPNQPKSCKIQWMHCSRGTYVATKLMRSFLTPTGGAGSIKLKGAKANSRPPCTQINDARGNLITGNCNTYSQTVRRKRQTQVQKKRDLLIMLDESGSVGKTNFQDLKLIAAGIVRDLCKQAKVGRYNTRVAVMTFDSQIHPHKQFSQYWKQATTVQKIKEIKYNHRTDGSTCMKKALDYAKNTVFTSQQGARLNDDNVQQDIILITDGCSNCVSGNHTEILKKASDQLIAKGIKTYVLGINLDSACRQQIKILGQGGNCHHFFHITKEEVKDVVNFFSEPPENCLDNFLNPDECQG